MVFDKQPPASKTSVTTLSVPVTGSSVTVTLSDGWRQEGIPIIIVTPPTPEPIRKCCTSSSSTFSLISCESHFSASICSSLSKSSEGIEQGLDIDKAYALYQKVIVLITLMRLSLWYPY